MAVVSVGASPVREFRHVIGNSSYMKDLIEIFNRILEPLYGSQADALNKIRLGKDRTCFILYEGEIPVGVIAFKIDLSDEFAKQGVQKSIEIKSLFVVNSESNSGRGLGSVLLNKVVEEADKLKLNHESLHVTVSEKKAESLNFFKRKGFVEKFKWKGRYVDENDVEYLLAAPAKLPTPQQVQGAAKIVALIAPPAAVQQPFSPKLAFWVPDAHWDDIHELKLLSDGTFISGSKDNCIVKWDQKGNLVRVVSEVEPDLISDKNWITATGVINDHYWASGERNGRVSLWTTEGDFVKNYYVKRPKTSHVSHKYNQERVLCLSSGTNKQKPTLFVGFPTMFDEYNVIEGRTTSSTETHSNDWVYCVHPLTESRALVVTGCVLDIFEKANNKWSPSKRLVEEGPRIGPQRRFISAVTPLKSSPHHFGFGVFGGPANGGLVNILDVEQGKIVRSWDEHKQRVWAVENISRELIASSAEDKMIKFWDVRADKSVATLDKSPGQSHALLSPNEDTLIAGVSEEVKKRVPKQNKQPHRRQAPAGAGSPQREKRSPQRDVEFEEITVTERAHLYFFDLRK